jgi:predicted 3-demethylubiquinone-9 3-methyltransferase (glyoxalase superfamily)
VPSELPQLLSAASGARLDRVIGAIMQMKKLDIETLRRAHAGSA